MIDKRTAASIAICLLMTGAPAYAGDAAVQAPVTSVSAMGDPVRAIISRQLNAIEARNADQAFATTGAKLHDKYANPVNFLAHLHYEFTPLYAHSDYKFLSRTDESGAAVQRVELHSKRGEKADAIFRVSQQPDGSWLIDSFAVMDGDENAI